MAANSESFKATVYPSSGEYTAETCEIISIGSENVRFTHTMPGSSTKVTRCVKREDISYLEGSAGKNGTITFKTRIPRLLKPKTFEDVNIDKYDGKTVTFTGINTRRKEKVTVTTLTDLVDFEDFVSKADSAKPKKKKAKVGK